MAEKTYKLQTSMKCTFVLYLISHKVFINKVNDMWHIYALVNWVTTVKAGHLVSAKLFKHTKAKTIWPPHSRRQF